MTQQRENEAMAPSRARIDRQKKAIRTILARIPSHRRRQLLENLRSDTVRMARGDTQRRDPATQTVSSEFDRQLMIEALPDPRNHQMVLGLSLCVLLIPLTFTNNSFFQHHPVAAYALPALGGAGCLMTLFLVHLDRKRRQRRGTLEIPEESPLVILDAIDELLAEH